jgi:DNA-directed RNA polymerase II subunit RPB2
MGECRNDYGGYFIVDGKEKVIVSQEKFADNMLYIKKNKPDNTYSYSAEIRSVSEDASKPIRTTAVKMVAGPANFGLTKYSMGQLVVAVPNVRKPVPLFILMRALGVISDKSIIEYCLLDLENNESYIDLFIPSIHDANKIFTQETALEFIALLTKRRTITGVLDILMNYFLPNVGEQNFLDKAYFVGYMVMRLLRVHNKEEKPTDRDSFRFKRVELTGSLIYDLFREYFLIQKRDITLKIDAEHYYHKGAYKEESFLRLIENNSREFFKERIVENGFKKAFKGNWGAEAHTKRVGAIQDLNRLSWNSFISQLRKINLPLDASAKVVGPRLLHSSQWGYIDPVDTPDGGNIGLHKHMAISTIITNGSSAKPLIKWLRAKTSLRLLQECNPQYLGATTKVLVNGVWIGVIDNPIETIKMLKLFRRNGLISVYTSISFNYESREIFIYTDAGRLSRPVYYIDNDGDVGSAIGSAVGVGEPSYNREDILTLINSGKFTWEEIIAGFKPKSDDTFYSKNNKIYDIHELYHSLHSIENVEPEFVKNKAVVDYIDTAEEEGALIATQLDDLKKSKYYTHLEIDPSLILGVLGNMVIFPENNPITRDAFSCGQSKQAVSVYHSNYQMRIDKMGVILNYGQIPLVKSRYLEYINKEEQPYGVNAIVAIMSYTGYNVEDAILINEGSIKRGMFNTTYFSMYESREESTKVSGTSTSSHFSNIESKNVGGIKAEYDYSHLDKYGIIKENTALDDKIVLIGKVTSDSADSDKVRDASVFPKKGQLGFVDKAFITEGEEGFRLAKIRVREERIPAIGDKMASRAGQKGTIGLIIPEADMPFTADGLKPDMIINPHAIPSRMTIGQLVETLLGKVGVLYGGFGDCTAFANKGPNTEVYGEILVRAGYHSSGNQLLYNGMTGEQIFTEIYIGPTYYMRLKHMVKDKINYRARGPNTMLTRQSVQGRANDGGLRIGEMERDGILAHGCAGFLNESYLVRGDEYFMAVCNKTGGIAVYNQSMNLFLSPFSDGPIKFNTSLDGKLNIQNVSRFGRSFSIVRVPYALKLLIQELQVLNIQMRIITEDNIDQLMAMSYSDNINKLLQDTNNTDLKLLLVQNRNKLKQVGNTVVANNPFDQTTETPGYNKFTNDNYNAAINSPVYMPGSPAYQPSFNGESPPNYSTNSESPQYNPANFESPASPVYEPQTPDFLPPPPSNIDYNPKIKNPELKAQWDALPEGDKKMLTEMLAKKRAEKALENPLEKPLEKALENPLENPLEKVLEKPLDNPAVIDDDNSILNVEKQEDDEGKDNQNGGSDNDGGSDSSTKSIKIVL